MSDYRYTRENFSPLPVKLDHLDIALDLRDGRVHGSNTLHMTALRPLREIALDARDLEVRSVRLLGRTERELPFDYQPREAKLRIPLPARVPAGRRIRIRTETVGVPTANVLEGIYEDVTPPGCPQQYMSQCQQWGFQRILPIFDDCTAKCTMTTSIEADARYTHLVSNGNVRRATNPDGRPAPKPGDPSRQVITFDNPVPMAPYLFIVCAGTWESLRDEVVYPSGRRVVLEYLVPPGRVEGARMPMRILKDSVLWHARTQGYEYPFDVYRTICMTKSNFGGMENLGNTTIVTDAALIDEHTPDERLLYAHRVIIHEFEHNECGSDVTMATPFDVWLNEAYTVNVERDYVADRFDAAFVRLNEVDMMRAPHGPLHIEDTGRLGRIVRDGFNHPDELIDPVTYVKAAEVIRMLREIVGPDAFRQAKTLYFSKFRGGNATTDDFFACFEEAAGRDLSQFKREWLFTIGYPKVRARHAYDAARATLRVELAQERSGSGGLFHVPVSFAAVDAQGRDMPGGAMKVELTGATAAAEVRGLTQAPAFVSWNRGCGFYGTFEPASATREELVRQVRLDPDAMSRVEAMRILTDAERIRLLRDQAAEPAPEWVSLVLELAGAPGVSPGIRSYLLQIDEEPLDRAHVARLPELFLVRRRLMRAVAGAGFDRLLAAFEAVDTYRRGASPSDGIEERRLKAVLLDLINTADTPRTHAICEEHFRRAWNASDRVSALSAINRSSHPGRAVIMREAFEAWHGHPNGYCNYLRVVGRGTHPRVFAELAGEERRPSFRIENPAQSRALFLPATMNNLTVWTDEGIAWVGDVVARLARVNEFVGLLALECCQHVKAMQPELRGKVLAMLERTRAAVDKDASPSVWGRLNAYITS